MKKLYKQVLKKSHLLSASSEFEKMCRTAAIDVSDNFPNETPSKIAYRTYNYVNRNLDPIVKPAMKEVSCKAGCSWCCHLRVSVGRFEVMAIMENMRKTMSESMIAEVLYAIAECGYLDDSLLETHSWVEQRRKCVFLQNGKCSIYKFRPLSCRGMTSLEPDMCREGCEERKTVEYKMHGGVKFVYEGAGKGVESQLGEKYGLGFDQLELHHALPLAFELPKSNLMLLSGIDPFQSCKVYL